MKSIHPTAGFTKSWLFPAADRARVLAYACQFDAPFWAKFDVQGPTRQITLPKFAGSVLITETLQENGPDGYRYGMTGVENIMDYQGWFTVEEAPAGQIRLTWKIAFSYQHGSKALVAVAKVFAQATPAMTKSLRQQFAAVQPATPG